jgi:hypothetical protein
MRVELGENQVAELHKTDPSDRHKGGFQAYMIELQERMTNQGIELEHEDLIKINRYAGYTSGGYQTRLKKIFGPTLGKYLHGLRS